MASPRLIPTALRAAPLAVLALLASWSALDVLAISEQRGDVGLLAALAFGVGLLLLAAVFRWRWLRPLGLGAVGSAYVLAHLAFLGFETVSGLAFVVLLICHVELRILADRFAGLYESAIATEDRARMRRALGRAVLRLAVASILGVLVPLLAANLASAGVVPLTTIPSAILLAAALVAVVLVIAILPSLQRRPAVPTPDPTHGAKDN